MTATELINIIAPEHTRTSCSDDNIGNGFYHKSSEEWDNNYTVITKKYIPRCSRCALLELENGRSVDVDKVIDGITIHFKIK